MNAEFVFSTMQMMAKSEIYEQYEKDAFDVIILDEYAIIGLSQEAA